MDKKQFLLNLLLLSLCIHNVYSQTQKNNNFKERILQNSLSEATLKEIQDKTNSYSQSLSTLNAQMVELISYDSQISFETSYSSTDAMIKKSAQIVTTISFILSFDPQFAIFYTGVYFAMQSLSGAYDTKTVASINKLTQQVYQLSNQIQNLKTEVLSSLNKLDEELSFRNIDQDIYLLQSLLYQYQELNSSNQLILYKMLCGNKLELCNQAFLSLNSGLKDYLKSVQTSSNWDRYTVTVQYVTYTSLLMNVFTVLQDLNLRIIAQEINISIDKMSQDQTTRYSQTYILLNALQSLSSDFDMVYASTYETSIQNIKVSTNIYNNLSVIPQGLLLGFFRGASGDGLTSITQTKVANRYDTIRNTVEINSQSLLDSNDSWMNCPKNSFLKGITLSDGSKIYNMEKFTCVSIDRFFFDTCQIVDINLAGSNSWVTCPDGMFITGLFRNKGDKIQDISRMSCCSLTSTKPSEIQDAYSNRKSYQNSWKPSGGDVSLTDDSKSPIISLQITNKMFSGQFTTILQKKNLTIEKTQYQDTLKTFDDPLKTGRCPQDYFLSGMQQSVGSNFHNIEKLMCVKYANTYWNQCFEQTVSQYESLQSCIQNNNCSSNLECEVGSYFAGIRRNTENSLYGTDRIVCCTMTSTSGLFKE